MSKNPIGKRRDKQKARTREVILASARELLETKGFDKTTIRDVASHAEIGLGTIYKHFANKHALLAAALLGDLQNLFDRAISTIPSDESLKSQFLHIARHYYTYYTTHPSLTRVYLINLPTIDAESMTTINNFDEAFANKVIQLANIAQDRGEISTEKNCEYVAMSLMADYFFVLITFLVRYNIIDAEEMLKTLALMLDQTI
jgi:AcrR family transcriptional regulator